MHQLLQRSSTVSVVRESDEESYANANPLNEMLIMKLGLTRQQLVQPLPAKLVSPSSVLIPESDPIKYRASARYINLHSYDAQSGQMNEYTETKIGGHKLDYKRLFDLNWQTQLQGPLKAAVWGTRGALESALSTMSRARTSLAYTASKPEVLVYSAIKIGGHPLDHVPFLSRGLPSRPLLGYMPESDRQEPLQVSRMTEVPPTAASYEGDPCVSTVYDCSRCLKVQQLPCVQLCCGHQVCAECMASDLIKHVEYKHSYLLECARCNDMIAIEAVAFAHYIVRMAPFSARAVSELVVQDAHPGDAMSWTRAWKQGGVLAGLSFVAGRYVSAKASTIRLKKRGRGTAEAIQLAEEGLLEEVEKLRGADLTVIPKDEYTTTTGFERWAKRVQGRKPPSKLLNFAFVRTLGIGNFAEVMLVQNRKKQFTVLKESDRLPEAVNEINILTRVRSPHVVQVRQYFIEEIGHRHFAYIELEYCDGGDLRELIEKGGQLEGKAFDSMFRQLCLGLKDIHCHRIIHRDLKPGNVLLTSDGTAKIADFGVSTYLESERLTHHAAGTLAFMAPEVRRYFLGEGVSYDTKADIWSLGALAVAMLTGQSEPRVATRPVEELVDELIRDKLDQKYIRLVEGTLAPHPADRSSLNDLLELLYLPKSRL